MIGFDDKFVLELGFGLLHLVDKDDGKLVDAITDLRKQKPYIPRLRIVDNMTLESFEISLNKVKHTLDEKEDLISQIVTIVDKYVEEHPEIQKEVKLVIKRGESIIFRFLQDGEEYKVKAKVLGITNDSVELEFEQKLKFQLQFLNKD